MNKLDMETTDIVKENIEKIGNLFPNTIVESKSGRKIDFDLLKQELSNDIVEGPKEKYQLTWPGKKEAILNANSKINKTLRPLKEKSVDFENTKNIYIEGDNLEALKILQTSYLHKVDFIYIDPPYNTGNDFVYNDNYKKSSDEELLNSGQIDEKGNKLLTNNSSNGRFHSDWLSMMYPRLKLARNLLTDNGMILISIDDNEGSNLKKICDEIYGESNFIAKFVWKGGRRNAAKYVSTSHEYMLLYANSLYKYNLSGFNLEEPKKGIEKIFKVANQFVKECHYDYDKATKMLKDWYKNLEDDDECKLNKHYNNIDEKGVYFPSDISRGGGNGPKWQIVNPKTGNIVMTPSRGWAYSNLEDLTTDIKKGLIHFNGDGVPCKKRYLNDLNTQLMETVFYKDRRSSSKKINKLMEANVFEFPKDNEILLDKFRAICKNKKAIVMDFFSGSSSTAHAIMELNAEDHGSRSYIMVQLPQQCDKDSTAYKNGYKTICDIGEERIRRAAKKIKEETNANIDYGFRIYKIDSSNMKDVYYKPNEVSQTNLFDMIRNIKEDRTSEDLLTQVILDLGITLDLKIKEKMILNNKVYYVENNSLVACFDDKIDINIIERICRCRPMKVVFRDSSFRTDKDKINIEEKIKKLSPETEISII